MNKKQLTCIICPNGCELDVEFQEKEITTLDGARCKRGREYAETELFAPIRTLTSLVQVKNGDLPLVSVRTDKPIPKEKIWEVMKLINAAQVEAPVQIGDVIVARPLELDCNIIATKYVESIA